MDSEALEKDAARKSARIYLPLAIGAALLFFVAASLAGPYTPVARVGGAIWVGILSLIVGMPLVTQAVKRRHLGK
jgi:hypothetical protein